MKYHSNLLDFCKYIETLLRCIHHFKSDLINNRALFIVMDCVTRKVGNSLCICSQAERDKKNYFICGLDGFLQMIC